MIDTSKLRKYSAGEIENSFELSTVEDFVKLSDVESALATNASAEPASRGAAQGRITQDNSGSSPADAGGLTPYGSINGEKCYRAAEVDALLATRAAQPDQDAQRYQRLRILGAAPFGTKQLNEGHVLCFQSLDDFLDADIAAHPSRGEFKPDAAPSAKPEPKLAGFQYRPDLSIRAVLYTDSINGTQVCRDDLWLATTADLNALASVAATSASASPAAPDAQRTTDEQVLAEFTAYVVRNYPPATIFGDPKWHAPRLFAAAMRAAGAAPVAGSQQVPHVMPKAVQQDGEPDESFYRRVVYGNGWNACREFLLAAAAPAVPVPADTQGDTK